MKKTTIAVPFFGIVSVITFIIWFGFSHEKYQITLCVSKVSRYVTAEFLKSETVSDKGKVYKVIKPSSKLITDVYTITKSNHMPMYPIMPKVFNDPIKYSKGFEGFKYHTDTILTINTINDKGAKSFIKDISDAAECLDKINQYMSVKKWYLIEYSIDFSE